MSDQLARVVKFKPAALKMSFMVWTATMPVLITPLIFGSVLVVLAALYVVYITFLNPSIVGLEYLGYGALLLLVFSFFIGLILATTAVAADEQIHISKDSIIFPLCLSPFLKFRRKRLWSEVAKVALLKNSSIDIYRSDIVMIFKSGELLKLEMSGFVDFGIDGFDNSELEKFLLACEVFATDADVGTDVVELRDSLGNESKDIGKISYTEIWEQELSNRFHATVFVPLEPGTILRSGTLKVIRQLAFGGLAAVYLAQKDGRELVILKEAVIPADQDAKLKAKAIEMFSREAKFLALLDHPRVAKVLDHFLEQNRNYLLMERITGPTIRQLVDQKGPQPERIVLQWCKEIAEILNYLHQQNPPIIHRDLTPENLILSDDGYIHLIDFGAANEFLGTVTGTVVGKQAFIAPEQFRGKATLSSDLYAFGGTMYFMLTGKNPLAMSVLKPKAIVDTLSDEVDQLVTSCSCQDATGRPESASILFEKLDRIGKTATVS
ncbi:MAG: serine/threonine-protein kinase [Candidatus Melainabacteria bacterium]|nr:serine/threonine-protein kinase [Candidatus Melainabacteria bacterium]